MEVEYEEDETVTEDVEVETVEEVSIPQVKAMYKYEGKNYNVAKGEVSVGRETHPGRQQLHYSSSIAGNGDRAFLTILAQVP